MTLHPPASLGPLPGRWLAQAPLLVGGLAGGVLLALFAAVVRGGVRQAEADHRAQDARTEATWRCNALRVRAERDACHCGLQAPATAQRADTAPGSSGSTISTRRLICRPPALSSPASGRVSP